MDRTGIIVVTLCAILLGIWFVEQQKYAQPQAAMPPTTSDHGLKPVRGSQPTLVPRR